KSRHIPRSIEIGFEGGSGSPGVLATSADNRRLCKRCLVPVALDDVTELMAVVLCHESAADRHHSFSPNEAADDPGVESLRVKFFRKPASVGYGGAADCASLAFCSCCARSDEQGTAASAIAANTSR